MALHFVVRLYGLDGIVRHSPILAAGRIPRIALDHIWRPRLHLRNRVLLGEASPIQPLDLAPFRERGNSLSFLRRPLVCRVGKAICFELIEIDARTQRFIAIATQQRAPIYVSLDVWDESET